MPDSPFAPVATVPPPPQSSSQNAFEAIDALKSDLLTVYRAVIALEKRVNDSTVNMVEAKPQLIALKSSLGVLPQRAPRTEALPNRHATDGFRTGSQVANLEARVKGAGVR